MKLLSRVSLLLLLAGGATFAQTNSPQTNSPQTNSPQTNSPQVKRVDVSIISSVSQAAAGSEVDLLLSQEIAAGWHTYWRTPGDSGAPIELTFQLPAGVSVSPFSWPYPERIPFGPLMNFGYHDRVLLPFALSIPAGFTSASGSLDIFAEGSVLVCLDICIPEKVAVSLSLPLGAEAVSAGVEEMFKRAKAMIPQPLQLPANWRISSGGDPKADLETGPETDLEVIASIALPFFASGFAPGFASSTASRIAGLEYFPFAAEVIENAAEQRYTFDEKGLHLALKPGYEFTPDSDLSGVLVVKGRAGGMLTTAYEISLPKMSSASDGFTFGQAPAEHEGMSTLLALLFAFLGGLILNLMPCVFPVLSIKILSLVGSSSEAPGGASVKLHGWAYSAGVVFSFVVIAALLIALRASGEAVGWGFQLQSPLVVATLAYLFVLIGLNLLGVFEMGTSIMSLGHAGGGQTHKLSSSFATGILATTVAAPCTAPFMGAAVGYALTQSTLESLLVLAFLGVGMAAPYLLLCYSPGLMKRLPRPGPWMETMKNLLAFPMLASAIWLVWVLGIQVGPDGMMQIMAGALSLSLAVWLMARRSSRTVLRLAFAGLALLGAIYALLLQKEALQQEVLQHDRAAPSTYFSQNALQKGGKGDQGRAVAWQPYSPEALSTALKQGPVFVNFTAAWCITCKVNELNALSSERFHVALAEKGVTYLRGDWTSEDPQITEALAEYGRSGVPLYLLYRQGASRASILPQLLTESIVLNAINSL